MSGVDPFTSSRAEVKALTKTVAFQLAQKGIRVNAIAPGLIATESNKILLQNEEKKNGIGKRCAISQNRTTTRDSTDCSIFGFRRCELYNR